MCGIIFELLYHGSSVFNDDNVLQRIRNRGPQCSYVVEVEFGNGVTASFCGAVLWMQGAEVTDQPVETENGILLYNGDIYDETWDKTIGDTNLIMQKLSGHQDEHGIVQALRKLKGPFSIIYYDKKSEKIFFTRDRIGRNTLLFHKSSSSIIISSVLGRKYDCIEIPASHIHVLNFKTNTINRHCWLSGSLTPKETAVDDWLVALLKQQSLPDEAFTVDLETPVNLEDDGVVTYIENLAEHTKCKLTVIGKLLENETISRTVSKVMELLERSVKVRVETQPQKCQECLHSKYHCKHCTVGVLFSGGLDCTILALLADKYLPKDQSIELLNVSFDRKETGCYDVPDRLTGRQSFNELKRLCPARKWVFIEINVSKAQLEEAQKTVIADLVYPRQTILDESLGSALWFAARGQDSSSTSCRVLLLGSGADELFGGYTRHMNAYRRHAWPGLHRELQLDWHRISFRNLARDNRVICDHGKQPRMPYLDEDLTDYVLKLPPWLKCFPNDVLGKEMGMKILLRLVAFQLGLKEVMAFPKRALQFGSRIANCKEKGSDVSKTFIGV